MMGERERIRGRKCRVSAEGEKANAPGQGESGEGATRRVGRRAGGSDAGRRATRRRATMRKSRNRRIRGMTSGRVLERVEDIARAIASAAFELGGATVTHAHLRSSDPSRPAASPAVPRTERSLETAVREKASAT
jgi:hypothetical protein